MENTSGFYKQDNDILYAPNFVLGAYSAYELRKETHQEHTYPIDGWYWFDNKETAYAFFGVDITTDMEK
jgi:hypothetical protein